MMNYNGSSLYGNYRTRTFSNVFETEDNFNEEWSKTKFSEYLESDETFEKFRPLIFPLLYARYANSNVASSDENRFKYQLFSIIYQYGPTWAKRTEIQEDLRKLDLDEARMGTEAIYNHAANPSSAPTTQTLEELPYINDQNVSKSRKSKLDAAMNLWDILKVDVTEVFIKEFQKLFITYVEPERPLWYATYPEED